MNFPSRSSSHFKPLEYAVRLLAQRPYHSVSLRRKMMEKGASAQEADVAIEQLQRMKYLDDRAYLGNFFRDQLERKAQSLRLVRQKLLQKGIPGDEITEFFDTNSGEALASLEVARARAAAVKKFAALGASSVRRSDNAVDESAVGKTVTFDSRKAKLALQQKVARFLAARGFSGEVIGKVLRETQ